jgi:hypothetical protein
MRTMLAGWLLVLSGCLVAPEDEELGAALRRLEELGVAAPGIAGQASPSAGEPAPLYLLTRRTAEHVDGAVRGLVGQVAAIASRPPAERGPGKAVWGPITSALSPVAYRLVAEGSPAGVRYRLEAWRKGEAGELVLVIAGEAAADGGAGRLHVAIARLRALDPAAALPDAPDAEVAYELEDGGATLGLRLGEAHYGHVARADGGGELSAPGLRAWWTAGGAGCAESAATVECWDERFRRVDGR